MCLDPDMVPPLAGFRHYAIPGVFTIFSLCHLDAFFKTAHCFLIFGLSVFWIR